MMAEPTATTAATATTITIGMVLRCVAKAILYYNIIGMLLAAVVATHQEAKIWSSSSSLRRRRRRTSTNKKNKTTTTSRDDLIPLNIMGHWKVFCFNLCWYMGCLFGSVYILLKHVVTCGQSDIAYDANRLVESIVANFVVTAFVGRVQVDGMEHLLQRSSIPQTTTTSSSTTRATTTSKTSTTSTASSSKDHSRRVSFMKPAPIFVANHCSQLDIGAVYRIFDDANDNKSNDNDDSDGSHTLITNKLQFKWIAKHSVLYLPGVGPLMWLGNHVLIYRRPPSAPAGGTAPRISSGSSSSSTNNNSMHKASVAQLFSKSREALQNGIAMFLFPQGTRRMTRGSSRCRSSSSTTTTTPTADSNNTDDKSDDSNDDDDGDDAHLPFKDGAFIMAEDNGSPLIPITIIIPRDNSCWNSWYPLNLLFGSRSSRHAIPTIRLVVHEPVLVEDAATKQKRSRHELKQLCYNAIYSVPELGGIGSETAKNK